MITFGLVAADLDQNCKSETTTQESILAPNPTDILESLVHFPGWRPVLFGLDKLWRDAQVFWMLPRSKSDLHFFWKFACL